MFVCLCAALLLSSVAAFQLYELMREDRVKQPNMKSCALCSPFLPCLLFKPDTSDRVVQRVSYQGNETASTLVKMDLNAQMCSIRNAIGLRIREREAQWMAAPTAAAKSAILPFDQNKAADRLLVQNDLGFQRHSNDLKSVKIFESYYEQYLALAKWGSVPADPAAPARYVSCVRFDQSVTDASKALTVRGVPVPFEENPAMQTLHVECQKEYNACRFDTKSLKLFTNKTMTAESGYLRGCGNWMLLCMLANTPDGKKVSVNAAQMTDFLAMYHQNLKIATLKAECLAVLQEYHVPESNELNSAEDGVLRILHDTLSYMHTTPMWAAICTEATACLVRALEKRKAAPAAEGPLPALVVDPVGAIDEARKHILQFRAAPCIAAKKQKELQERQAEKLALFQKQKEADEKKAQAEREANEAQKAAAEALKKAKEQAEAAAAVEDEDEEKKQEQRDRAEELKQQAQQEAAKAKAAAKKAQSASAAAALANKDADAAADKEKEADAAVHEVPVLPPVAAVDAGPLPHFRGGQKSKARARQELQTTLAKRAQDEAETLLVLQPPPASDDAMNDGVSGISGSTGASTVVPGVRRSLDYLRQHFPAHQADALEWLKQQDPGAKLYDVIVMHPPGIAPSSQDYTDQPLTATQLNELVNAAALLLKPGGTMAIHCTFEQSVKICHVPISLGVMSIGGCRLESAPVHWYYARGEPRPNQSTNIVAITRYILLLHKPMADGRYHANFKFADYPNYKTIGEQSNMWIAPPLESVKEEMLRVDRHSWEKFYKASQEKKPSEREKELPIVNGLHTLPVAELHSLSVVHDDYEHEGGNYEPSTSATPRRDTTGSARKYTGVRTQRMKLRASEIPQNISERILKIFLPDPAEVGGYANMHVLDVFSGTQSVALAAAVHLPGLTVENVDFDCVVTAAAQLRLLHSIDERFSEQGQSGTSTSDLQSLFYRSKLQGLLESEQDAKGANLGPELHRECAHYYRQTVQKETNCRDAHGVCKCCGKVLVALARHPQDNTLVVWEANRGINPITKRDGFCDVTCQAFDSHVVLPHSHPSGGSTLTSHDNLLHTAFYPPPAEEDLIMPHKSANFKAELDKAMWKRVPEPNHNALDFDQREAIQRDEAMWGIRVVLATMSEGSNPEPVDVTAGEDFEAGDVMGALTGDVVEEGTEHANSVLKQAAVGAFRRPPVDITSLLWLKTNRDQAAGVATKRQWLIPSRLCASSWIRPSDAAHPANVTISPNFLAMSPHSRIGDMSIFPPGALSIIANAAIKSGQSLFYDAKQLVTRPRNLFSTAPVLTSDPHDEPAHAAALAGPPLDREESKEGPAGMELDEGSPVAAVVAPSAARADSSAEVVTYVQPWYANEWLVQLGQQKKLPAKRKSPAKRPKAAPKDQKWIEAEVESDDDEEIDHKFETRAVPSKLRSARVCWRSLPQTLKSLLDVKGVRHELEFEPDVGFKPKKGDEQWFKDNKDAQDALDTHNADLKRDWASMDTQSRFGLGSGEDEAREAFHLDQLVPEKMESYAHEAVLKGFNVLRERMRRVPRVAHEEINLLKGQGTDLATQEELRQRMDEDIHKSSNQALNHSYASLIMENPEQLNQYSLLKRALFFEALLGSDALRAWILKTAAAQSSVKPWQLCKLFLQQYCKILDALDKVAGAGQSNATHAQPQQHSADDARSRSHSPLCCSVCDCSAADGKLELADSPSAAENTVDEQHWKDINSFAEDMCQESKDKMLPRDDLLWGRFMPDSRLILVTTDTEKRADPAEMAAGLFQDASSGLLFPSTELRKLEENQELINLAVREAFTWNNAVGMHRRMVYGRELFTLREYRTCQDQKTVSKKFALEWDQWERGGKAQGLEPKPPAGDKQVFKIFLADRKLRCTLFNLLPGEFSQPAHTPQSRCLWDR